MNTSRISHRRTHILFLTDNFPPEVNAPASRTFEHCREWVRAGHQVTVITGAPNFPRGKVYEGYRNKLWQSEAMDGIRVIRVWTYIAANRGFIKRILDYVSYMVSATLASACVRRPDIVIATSPMLFTAMAGCMVGGMRRIPFVFELRDMWPESIKAVGAMNDSLAIRFFEKIEMFLYRKASKIVSVTESFRNNLIQRDVDPEKINVVTNGVDLSRFSPVPKDKKLVEEYGLGDKFVAGYIGTHGMAHSLETILDAADQMRKTEGGDQFRFIFLGDGARKVDLIGRATELKLDNVIFIDSVPKEEVVRYWSLLDVSIIHLKKTPLFTTVIPSKLFECMGMGIPILHGVAGESAEIVEREECGLVFEPENAGELCAKLMTLRDDHDLYQRLKGGCIKAAKGYDRVALAHKMLKILKTQVEVEV